MTEAKRGQGGGERPGAWARAPRFTPADLAALVWRERRTALAVLAGCLALAAVLALISPSAYRANTGVLVRLGQEHVFNPKVGVAGAGATPKLEEVVNAELRLLQSPEVARRVIAEVGLPRLYPSLARPGDAAAQERRLQGAVRAYQRRLSAVIAPQSPVIGLSFTHRNAETAAAALNAHVEAYLAFRREVLVDGGAGAYAAQGDDLQARLIAANAALGAFLKQNDISDFIAEQAALAEIQGRLEGDILQAEASAAAAQGEAAALRRRVGAQPDTIELYAESDARQSLVALKVERAQLLARYEPTAAPVVEVDRRIAEVEGLLAAGPQPGLSRSGPNPVRQELEAKLFALEAQAQAQSAQSAALKRQRAEVGARLDRLRALEPEFRRLDRERTILAEGARSFDERAASAAAFEAVAGASGDTVRAMERATAPARGSSPRGELLAAGLGLGLLLGAAAALIRGLGRGGFATAAAAGRTLETPVLGVSPRPSVRGQP